MIKQAQLHLNRGLIQNLGHRSVFNQVDFLKTTKDAVTFFLVLFPFLGGGQSCILYTI